MQSPLFDFFFKSRRNTPKDTSLQTSQSLIGLSGNPNRTRSTVPPPPESAAVIVNEDEQPLPGASVNKRRVVIESSCP